MARLTSIEYLWLLLMAITLGNAVIAESADTNFIVTLLIAVSVAFKGRMVVDHFMELKNANRHIRKAMRLYFYIIPALFVLVYLFPKQLVRMTTL